MDVYGGFGQKTDWAAPFLTLTDDGTGTFTGTASLPDGSYPYLFRPTGTDDGLVEKGRYFVDQNNPSFAPSPPGSPQYVAGSKVPRSVSSLTVPQGPASVVHIKGSVVFGGAPQPCFSVDLEAGEVTKPGGGAAQEHNTANYTESASDGTFDFPVTPGAYQLAVRYPFPLYDSGASYPDPVKTGSLGCAVIVPAMVTADTTLPELDARFPGYATMSPSGGSASLPATFDFSLVPGSLGASFDVIGTSTACDDPAYATTYGTATSVTYDGTIGSVMTGKTVTLGQTYYWGTRQKLPASGSGSGGAGWTTESLLFPIVFH